MEYKTAVITSEITINKNQIKKILKGKLEVPGARLITDKQRLMRG